MNSTGEIGRRMPQLSVSSFLLSWWMTAVLASTVFLAITDGIDALSHGSAGLSFWASVPAGVTWAVITGACHRCWSGDRSQMSLIVMLLFGVLGLWFMLTWVPTVRTWIYLSW